MHSPPAGWPRPIVNPIIGINTVAKEQENNCYFLNFPLLQGHMDVQFLQPGVYQNCVCVVTFVLCSRTICRVLLLSYTMGRVDCHCLTLYSLPP